MNTNSILSAPLIDIVFDGRNKDYGAYLLRKTYPKRLLISLFITSILFALAFGGAAIGRNKKSTTVYKISPEVNLVDISKKKPIEIEKPKPKQKMPEPVKTRILTEPKLTDEPLERPMPDQQDLEDAKIGDINMDGKPSDGIVSGPSDLDNGKEIIVEKEKEKEDEILSIVEVPAKFPGNWVKFLLRNLDPEVPIDHDAPNGTYSVVIRFVVDKQGNISEVNAVTNHGYGMEEEAIRVIKKAGKWEPAIQNGYAVKAYHKQVITFQVLGE